MIFSTTKYKVEINPEHNGYIVVNLDNYIEEFTSNMLPEAINVCKMLSAALIAVEKETDETSDEEELSESLKVFSRH